MYIINQTDISDFKNSDSMELSNIMTKVGLELLQKSTCGRRLWEPRRHHNLSSASSFQKEVSYQQQESKATSQEAAQRLQLLKPISLLSPAPFNL